MTEAISRSLTAFGRYPEKRPRGLNVDATGAFKLSDLMTSWGHQKGYTEEQVKETVYKHMYKDRRSQEQRFAIEEDDWGETTITVMQKGARIFGGANGQGLGKDPWNQLQWQRGDRIQRWLSYMLKRGFKESGVRLQDGWGKVDDLARAFGRQKPEFNVRTADQLQSLLEQHDQEGRFEIDRGWLRKVPREERELQPTTSSKAAKSENASDDEAEDTGRTGAIVPGARAPAVVPGGPSPPGDNPSKFWKQFKDGDALWYYYEGPLGKWWCQDKDEPPVPFEDD